MCGLWFAIPCSGGPGRQTYDIFSISGTVCIVGIYRRKRALTFFSRILQFLLSFFDFSFISVTSTTIGPLNGASSLGQTYSRSSFSLPLGPFLYIHTYIHTYMWLSGKESTCYAAGDMDSTPGSGRSPGEGSGNPLQYSGLGNPVDRGAWRATVHGVAKSWTLLSAHTHTHTHTD